jgi:hypothetical protein
MTVTYEPRDGNRYGPKYTVRTEYPSEGFVSISRDYAEIADIKSDDDARYCVIVCGRQNTVIVAMSGTQIEELYAAYQLLRTGYEGINNG